MDESWALRLAMASLSVLPALPLTYAAVVSVRHGAMAAPPAAGWLAVAVGVLHAVFWLAPTGPRARRVLVAVAVPVTLAAVAWPGAAGGAFLLWAYPAVMVGFAASPRWVVPAVAALCALTGLVINAATGHGGVAFTGVEATAVTALAGTAAGAVSQLQRSNAALRRAETRIQQLAVEQERARLARDLHDLLGQSLSLIQVKLAVLGQVLDDPVLAGKELSELDDLTSRALQETRQAVTGYRQPTLASEVAGARIACDAAGIALQVADRTGPIPEAVEAILAWSVREAITNVVRHSAASTCRLHLVPERDTVRLSVCDNGHGAPPGYDGSGLRTLRERVTAAGGTVTTHNRPGAGFTVQVHLPTGQADPP